MCLSRVWRKGLGSYADRSRWTTGRKSINRDKIRKIAMARRVFIHELIFDEPDQSETRGEEILK